MSGRQFESKKKKRKRILFEMRRGRCETGLAVSGTVSLSTSDLKEEVKCPHTVSHFSFC